MNKDKQPEPALALAGRLDDCGKSGTYHCRQAHPGKIVQVEILSQLAEEGANWAKVRQTNRDLKWDLTEFQLRRLYRTAEGLAYRRLRTKAKNGYAESMFRLDGIFRRAVEAGDLTVQVQVMKEINKLKGLYPEVHQTLNVNQKISGEVRLTADKVWDQIKVYEDEFRMAAKAERLEKQLITVTGADLADAGHNIPLKERNRGVGGIAAPEENHGDEPILEDIPDE